LATDDSFTFSADNLRHPAPETVVVTGRFNATGHYLFFYRQFAYAVTGNSHGVTPPGAIIAPVDTG
jgi:hypothetical protein